MKKLILIVCAVFVIMCAFVPRSFKSGIQGTIDPPEGAKKIWAVSGIDSVGAVSISGRFGLEVNPGTWKLFVEASPPYKSVVLENVTVREDQINDVGVIKLSQ